MTSSTAAVRITSLPRSLLRFPPASIPSTLPVPAGDPTFAHPFTIPPAIYNGLLSANVPIGIALLYASIVTYLNSVNARRKYKPWPVSKTGLFKLLVTLHNVFLALYSAWTCAGMFNALRLALPEWQEYGLVGIVDSVCKINGPRGLGDAATFNATSSVWEFTNQALHLGADGLTPDTTDVGRIWNEGLAFYGWLFYISKFYEVIDTFIILSKGKKSSFLQTYHHAGAMMCMWAGIRYMAQPIWMFVLVNSALHAIMYTYYTLTILSFQPPRWFKKTLTTLQITQFVVGASYAFVHLFIAYQIPVSTPYLYHLGDVASAVIQDFSSAASVATATASAGAGAWLKKAAFRAAGREGLAENVMNQQGQTFGVDAVHAAKYYQTKTETRYRDEVKWVHCLDTSGQVFAILLNCMYLLPLTMLFLRFFARAYAKRIERRRSSTTSEKAKVAGWATKDAAKGVARQLIEAANEGAVSGEDEPKTEVLAEPKDNVNGSPKASPKGKREVGDESAPQERTPELKQDDSFVKVEAEPESPKEAKSGKRQARKEGEASGNTAGERRAQDDPTTDIPGAFDSDSGSDPGKAKREPNSPGTKGTGQSGDEAQRESFDAEKGEQDEILEETETEPLVEGKTKSTKGINEDQKKKSHKGKKVKREQDKATETVGTGPLDLLHRPDH